MQQFYNSFGHCERTGNLYSDQDIEMSVLTKENLCCNCFEKYMFYTAAIFQVLLCSISSFDCMSDRN